jgi:hypothetical protein
MWEIRTAFLVPSARGGGIKFMKVDRGVTRFPEVELGPDP